MLRNTNEQSLKLKSPSYTLDLSYMIGGIIYHLEQELNRTYSRRFEIYPEIYKIDLLKRFQKTLKDEKIHLSPLAIAAEMGKTEDILNEVINGADLLEENKFSHKNALDYAADNKQWAALEFMVERSTAINVDVTLIRYAKPPVSKALSRGDQSRAASLLILNHDINARNHYNGMTALHDAVNLCSLNNVKFLLKHNADVTITDNSDVTPLQLAMFGFVSTADKENFERIALTIINAYTKPISASDLDFAEKHQLVKIIAAINQHNHPQSFLRRHISLFAKPTQCTPAAAAAAPTPATPTFSLRPASPGDDL